MTGAGGAAVWAVPPSIEHVAMPPRPAPPPRHRRRQIDSITTIRDTVQCSWLFYSNSSQSTSTAGASETAAAPQQRTAPPDPDLDQIHMMLDPHLRPISPDPESELSKNIFEEHKQIAQEYLKVQTELAYLSKHKAELESGLDEDTLRHKRELIQLENERNSLIKLVQSLTQELNMDDNWMSLPEDSPNE